MLVRGPAERRASSLWVPGPAEVSADPLRPVREMLSAGVVRLVGCPLFYLSVLVP